MRGMINKAGIWMESLENELAVITSRLNKYHPIIRDAVRYSLLGGGKRTRAVLVRMFCELLDGAGVASIPCACAVEMIHTYSLIHDDLPCMDDDDLRRGKPSCHKVFSEAVALLAGDALQALAFETILTAGALTDEQKVQAAAELARLCGANGMVGGQALDMMSEGQSADVDTMRKMDEGKTCALIEAACVMGCIAAGQTGGIVMPAARDYARGVGMAFQIVDDILDVNATTEQLGKPAGSDLANAKSTYVSIFGLDEAKRQAEEYTKSACDALASLGEKAKDLREFAERLLNRMN